MATLNSEATIERALDSIMLQQNIRIRLIVIDGGSTDKTIEIVSRYSLGYGDCEIDIFYDGRLYPSLNFGVENVDTDHFMILHSDDFLLHPFVLSTVVDFMDAKGVDVVSTGIYYSKNTKRFCCLNRYPPENFNISKMKMGFLPPHPGSFYRITAAEFINFKTNYSISSDLESILQLARNSALSKGVLDEYSVGFSLGGLSTRGFNSRITALYEDLDIFITNFGLVGIFYTLLKKIVTLPLLMQFRYLRKRVC